MKTDSVLSAVVAVLCILSVGFASTTLDDSVETKPEDVIDIDYDKLPINPQQAREFKGDNIQTADPDATGTPSEKSEQETATANPQPGDGNEQRNRQEDSSATTESQGLGQGMDPRVVEPSLLDKLLSLLMTLLPFVLIGAVLAVAVKKRRTIAGWFETADHETAMAKTTVVARPENEVYQAWHEVASVIPYGQRKAMTPSEVAEAVREETELEDDLLMELTTTFKRIRYGGAALSTEDRELAARVQEQLQASRVARR